MSQAQWHLQNEFRSLYLIASEKGLQEIYWRQRPGIPLLKDLQDSRPEARILAQAARELEEYFTGRRREFQTPLDLQGTDFQKKVWKTLLQIPYGETWSYRDVAEKIQNAKAVRAVGSANGKNPVCIIVPCHRVIAADGSLGGYSGGLPLKLKLLNLEHDGAWQARSLR